MDVLQSGGSLTKTNGFNCYIACQNGRMMPTYQLTCPSMNQSFLEPLPGFSLCIVHRTVSWPCLVRHQNATHIRNSVWRGRLQWHWHIGFATDFLMRVLQRPFSAYFDFFSLQVATACIDCNLCRVIFTEPRWKSQTSSPLLVAE